MEKLISIAFLVTFLSCNIRNDNNINENSKDINSIKEVLYLQQKCWNNGDINGFMQGYWSSDKLIFTSDKYRPAYGWENTLNRYKESYPNISSMGELRFEILDIELTSKKTADLYGKWELIRDEDRPEGFFWLELKKFNQNWLITKDSTIEEYVQIYQDCWARSYYLLNQ